MQYQDKQIQLVDLQKESPLISIIIVVYNAGQYLEQTLLSVIQQTYKHIELIIIDGGSSDNTIEILKRYDDRISYWKSEPDKGIYDAMNKAIDIATGNWVYFLGAGDILLNVLHQIVPKMLMLNHIYYGNVYWNDRSIIYDGRFSAFKLAVSNICHQAIFYPLAAIKRYKFNTQYRILADHHLNMQCFGDADFKFTYLPNLICIYDGDGFSSRNNVDELFFKDKPQIIKANFSFIVFGYTYLRRKLAAFLKK